MLSASQLFIARDAQPDVHLQVDVLPDVRMGVMAVALLKKIAGCEAAYSALKRKLIQPRDSMR